MAAAASSLDHNYKYDVFLSFSGPDTRKIFIGHLHKALERKLLTVFNDTEDLHRGAIIQSIPKAIEDSKLSVVVFSENYAFSGWRMRELAQIVECMDTKKQLVVPIFYGVDPADVRYQKKKFEDDFAKHEGRETSKVLERWRSALNRVADLSGWDSRNYQDDAQLIEEVVEDVFHKLIKIRTFSSSFVGPPASETMDVATRNPGDWICPECFKPSSNKSQFQRHMRLHEKVKITCEAKGCPRSFFSHAQIQSHKKSMHPELLVGKKKKKKAKAKPSDVPSVPCPVCGVLFSNEEHLRIAHRLFGCPICSKFFNAEVHLRSHLRLVHPRHGSCDICARFFFTEEALRQHNKAKGHGSSFFAEKTVSTAESPTGKSEVMVNQREPTSIFVMLSSHAKHYGFLYEIEFEKLEKNEGDREPLLRPAFEFFDKKWEIPMLCLIDGARFGSKVYLLCNEIKFPYRSPFRPTDAFCFDTNDLNLSLQQFSPPKSPKIWCAVISAYGKLYYIAQPTCFPYIENDSFERYDHADDSWESLPPYPHYSWANVETQISGHAVLYGYILFSMITEKGNLMAAFHITSKTWHEVSLSRSMKKIYDGFRGRAVVVDNIIYAPSSALEELLAFSFCWVSIGDDDIAMRAHYIGPLVCRYIKDQAPLPCPFDLGATQRLIHLGGRDMCLVQTGWNQYSLEDQYLIVACFRVFGEGEEMYIQTLQSRTFRVPTDKDRYYFDVEFGFTRDCSEIEPEEGERCLTAFATSESS